MGDIGLFVLQVDLLQIHIPGGTIDDARLGNATILYALVHGTRGLYSLLTLGLVLVNLLIHILMYTILGQI